MADEEKDTTQDASGEEQGQEQETAGEETTTEEKVYDKKPADAAPQKKEAAPEKKEAASEKKDAGAPAKYDLKVPEGSNMKPEAVERIAAFAKEQGLSQKAAQALVERESKLLSSYAEEQQVQLKAMSAEWGNQSRDDKEFGGEAFNQNAELAKRVVSRYGSEDLRKGLEVTGFGNHPELVRMLVRIGKAMSEDQLVLPGGKSAEKKEMADILYPSHNNKT